MANHLFDMLIDEISLVGDPSNDLARVQIVKARKLGKPEMIAKAAEYLAPRLAQILGSGDHSATDTDATIATLLQETAMDLEILEKSLETAEARMATLELQAEESLQKSTELAAANAAQAEEIAKLKGGKVDEEDVLKGLSEPLRERFAKMEAKMAAAEAKTATAEAEIAKSKSEAEQREYITKSKALNLADDVGVALYRVAKGKSEVADAELLEKTLKGLAAIAKDSNIFRRSGTSYAATGEPEQILKAKADDIRKASGGKLTAEQAFDAALTANPELYEQSQAIKRTAA